MPPLASFLTECDQDLRILRGSYEGLKSPNKVRQNIENHQTDPIGTDNHKPHPASQPGRSGP